MDGKFLKPYDPKETESNIYQLWEDSGFFNPDVCVEKGVTDSNAEVFSIVLPPPNVTGTLHVGHAYEDSLQDAVVRYKRMRGKKVLWLPGTDSAAIATQARVEKNIQKEEGKSRHDIGREELVRRVSEFAKNSENTILSQIRKMGASLDWSRYAYTLDEKRNHAVATAFKNMYEAGLIYRGSRIVNWDPKGQTTISDDEIVHEERDAKLYTFKYSKDFPISISTTRPETKVGDVAVAVHPDDERYSKFVGKEYEAVFCDVPIKIKIISDREVDKEFGTGALGVTPAHSMIDWEIADRNNLDRPQIINEYAKMTVEGRLNGLKTVEAREAVVLWLKSEGLLEKEEDIKQNIATAERTGGIVEPLPKLQWFVGVNKSFIPKHSEIAGIKSGDTTTLKELMRTSVESGAVDIPQDGFRKTYFHWIDNLRDWCISRQIWFGHRIPIWYKRELGTSHQAKHFPEELLFKKLNLDEQGFRKKTMEWNVFDYAKAGGSLNIKLGPEFIKELKDRKLIDDLWIENNQIKQPSPQGEIIHCGTTPPEEIGWTQDPDVLDTWFSSALWTFSTLGWPEKTKDLETYHPTSFMSPAYEILNLWVSRMILMSAFHLGQAPFKLVLIHGLVRNKDGKKFSKSLANGIDPLDMIEKYGADALRMGLLAGGTIGSDIRFDESKVKGYKNFANKLWNITRFILENGCDEIKEADLTDLDKALLKELGDSVKDITDDMENYRFHLATEKIYHYIWDRFASQIIEESKLILKGDDMSAKNSRQITLFKILNTSLKILHPFMPFVTEEIWQTINTENKILMVEKWPI